MSFNACDEFLLMSSIESQRRPFNTNSIFGNQKTYHSEPGLGSREVGVGQSSDFRHITGVLTRLNEFNSSASFLTVRRRFIGTRFLIF